MFKRIFCIMLLSVTLFSLVSCRKAESSANGDNLAPQGVKESITKIC